MPFVLCGGTESGSAGVGSSPHSASQLRIFISLFCPINCICSVARAKKIQERSDKARKTRLGSCLSCALCARRNQKGCFVLTVSLPRILKEVSFKIKPRHMQKKKRKKEMYSFPAHTSCYPSFLQPSPCLGAEASPVNQFCCIAKSVHSSLMRQQGMGMPEPWAPGRQDRRLKENKQSGRVTKCTSDGGHTHRRRVWEAQRKLSGWTRISSVFLFFFPPPRSCLPGGRCETMHMFLVSRADLQSLVETTLDVSLLAFPPPRHPLKWPFHHNSFYI